MGWAQGSLAGYDLETDSANPEDARIITATVLRVEGDRPIENRPWLLQTERPIAEGAFKVHGISTDRANQHGAERELAIEEIATHLQTIFITGTPVVGFNVSFDFTILDRECRRVGIPTLTDRLGRVPSPVIDPHVIDKAADKFRRGSRTLGATCEFYGIELGNAHDATADALGAVRLAQAIAAKYPEVGEASLESLHRWQVGWRAAQMSSLESFHKSQGKGDGDYDGSWPLRPLKAVTS
ncbi:MAG: 3'-5' exonuclease [Streptomyces sp.]|nr:3'-5' exonuclease [Streptomyces sp.]